MRQSFRRAIHHVQTNGEKMLRRRDVGAKLPVLPVLLCERALQCQRVVQELDCLVRLPRLRIVHSQPVINQSQRAACPIVICSLLAQGFAKLECLMKMLPAFEPKIIMAEAVSHACMRASTRGPIGSVSGVL